ncbi:MAG: hypothetical protein ABJQ70_09880 [Roseobacter sp.]
MTTDQGPSNTDTPTPAQTSSQPMLDVDLNAFAHHLDGSDLSDAEKREYLSIFWNIVIAFVDLGYGLNPAQDPCEQLPKTPKKTGFLSADSLDLRQFTDNANKEVQP